MIIVEFIIRMYMVVCVAAVLFGAASHTLRSCCFSLLVVKIRERILYLLSLSFPTRSSCLFSPELQAPGALDSFEDCTAARGRRSAFVGCASRRVSPAPECVIGHVSSS